MGLLQEKQRRADLQGELARVHPVGGDRGDDQARMRQRQSAARPQEIVERPAAETPELGEAAADRVEGRRIRWRSRAAALSISRTRAHDGDRRARGDPETAGNLIGCRHDLDGEVAIAGHAADRADEIGHRPHRIEAAPDHPRLLGDEGADAMPDAQQPVAAEHTDRLAQRRAG
jgi:hypothetical protein